MPSRNAKRRSLKSFIVLMTIACCGSFFSFGQSSAEWLRLYKGTSTNSVTRDPRFKADIHRFLADGPSGGDVFPGGLAKTAAAYMTNETEDDVHVHGDQVTVDACANRGGECALL